MLLLPLSLLGLTLALAASKREELSAKICEPLAMAVESSRMH